MKDPKPTEVRLVGSGPDYFVEYCVAGTVVLLFVVAPVLFWIGSKREVIQKFLWGY